MSRVAKLAYECHISPPADSNKKMDSRGNEGEITCLPDSWKTVPQPQALIVSPAVTFQVTAAHLSHVTVTLPLGSSHVAAPHQYGAKINCTCPQDRKQTSSSHGGAPRTGDCSDEPLRQDFK